VLLDQERAGLKYAVINTDTKGRIALMSSAAGGRLTKGRRVTISEAQQGSEGFRALSVV